MTRDQVDELMRENGIVVVGEAVYILCNLVEAESAAAEREACAQVCNDISKDSRGDWKNGAMECEEAIRARALHDINKAAEKNGEPL